MNRYLFIEIDTKNDYKVLKAIGDHFVSIGKDDFSLRDIIEFLSNNPEIAEINSKEHRNYWQIKAMPND